MRGDIYLRGNDVKETTFKLTFLLSPTRSFCFSFSTLKTRNLRTTHRNDNMFLPIERSVLELLPRVFIKMSHITTESSDQLSHF